jgi:hypothetical protein
MASTRNINYQNNFNLEQKNLQSARNYLSFNNGSSGRAYQESIPCLGITPSNMPRDALSKNSVDIESYLRGTNLTNLVNPSAPVKPQLITLPSSSFFERLPFIEAKPLVIDKTQRPHPI